MANRRTHVPYPKEFTTVEVYEESAFRCIRLLPRYDRDQPVLVEWWQEDVDDAICEGILDERDWWQSAWIHYRERKLLPQDVVRSETYRVGRKYLWEVTTEEELCNDS